MAEDAGDCEERSLFALPLLIACGVRRERDDRRNRISRDAPTGHREKVLCWAFVIRLKMLSSRLRHSMRVPRSPLINWLVASEASYKYDIFV